MRRSPILPALLCGCVLPGCGSDAAAPAEGPETDPRDPVGRIVFSHLPVDPDRVVAMQPLGNLNVLPEDHGGFYLPAEGLGEAPTVPLYAPADGRIVDLGLGWASFAAPHGKDLDFEIRVSTTMVVSFAHVSELAPEIWEAAGNPDVPEAGPRVHLPVEIEVGAGQVIGYVGSQIGIDWYVGDSELELSFLNPSRYPDPWLITGCYLDYYSEPLRSRLAALSLRDTEPKCGKTDFDVAGRIVGNWFLEGEVPPYAFDDYSTHLAIVYDEFYGERIAISDGIALRPDSPHEGDENYGAGRVFWVEGNGPTPETVGVEDGLVKYGIIQRPPLRVPDPPADSDEVIGVFLVEMLDPDRIQVERVMGKTPAEVSAFGGNARIYVR